MTMAALPPGGTAAAPQTEEERRFFVEEQAQYVRDDAAHRGIHGTKFQTMAFHLEDSPVGLLAWIVDKWWILADIMREDEKRRAAATSIVASRRMNCWRPVAIYWFTRNSVLGDADLPRGNAAACRR